jgi:membrane associated rhomboid family serine protease
VTEHLTCYRHKDVETAVRCSDCERPICTDCMSFGPVGIRCPECSGQKAGPARTARTVRAAATSRGGMEVTKVLIGINVLVFLVQLVQSGGFRTTSGEIFFRGALYGPAVADGEWWRLLTSGFLHANLIHLGFNMLMLWWFGGPLESLLGRWRYLTVYLLSLLAGAAGALLARPNALTVGASGAVFGILGAGLYLERKQIYVFGGGAMGVVVLNLVLSFVFPGVSWGGHIGGLVGGILAAFCLSRFGRAHAAYGRFGPDVAIGLATIAVGSVVVAYLRVRGYA